LAVKLRDLAVKIPLKELEQKNPLGESLVFQDKRPSKCATPFCKIQIFFNFYRVLILSWQRKRTRLDVRVVADSIAPTIPANPAVVRLRFSLILSCVSASAVTAAASVQHRCRFAF